MKLVYISLGFSIYVESLIRAIHKMIIFVRLTKEMLDLEINERQLWK